LHIDLKKRQFFIYGSRMSVGFGEDNLKPRPDFTTVILTFKFDFDLSKNEQ